MNWGLILGAALLAYLWYQSQQSATAATTTATGTTTATVVTPSALTLPASLAAIGAALTAAVNASNDPSFTAVNGVPQGTPEDWTDYLVELIPNSPVPGYDWPPDLTQVFPNVDLTQPMSGPTYWSGMSAYLGSKMGMSGGWM